MRTLNISEEGFLKFMNVHTSRVQDTSRAQTFDHILIMYEGYTKYWNEKGKEREKGIVHTRRIIAGNASSPIIDADQLQIAGVKKP